MDTKTQTGGGSQQPWKFFSRCTTVARSALQSCLIFEGPRHQDRRTVWELALIIYCCTLIQIVFTPSRLCKAQKGFSMLQWGTWSEEGTTERNFVRKKPWRIWIEKPLQSSTNDEDSHHLRRKQSPTRLVLPLRSQTLYSLWFERLRQRQELVSLSYAWSHTSMSRRICCT